MDIDFPGSFACKMTFNLSHGAVVVLETAPATPPETKVTKVLLNLLKVI